MIRIDRNALMCDFAETYGIYDIWSLPARLAATYAVGLRADSRIIMKITGAIVPTDTILLARAVDLLALLLWSKTKDGQHNRNRPESIAEKLLSNDEETTKPERKNLSFDSPEEFEEVRRQMIQRIVNGYRERGDF